MPFTKASSPEVMVDPTLIAAANRGLEATLNQALRYDPATTAKLRKLDGQTILIHMAELDFDIGFSFSEDGISVKSWMESPTTRLSGTLPDLLRLYKSDSASLAGSGVTLEGDSQLLAELKAILSHLEIDWEEALSTWAGELPAHELASRIREQLIWLGDRKTSIVRLVEEFITEEARTTPGKNEFESRAEDIHQLRQDVDRLNAKLANIENKLSNSGKDS